MIRRFAAEQVTTNPWHVVRVYCGNYPVNQHGTQEAKVPFKGAVSWVLFTQGSARFLQGRILVQLEAIFASSKALPLLQVPGDKKKCAVTLKRDGVKHAFLFESTNQSSPSCVSKPLFPFA